MPSTFHETARNGSGRRPVSCFQGGRRRVLCAFPATVPGHLYWAAAACLLLPVGAHAQLTGAFDGTVTDPSGRAVTGAQIRAFEINTGAERRLVTDQQGWYAAADLAPGRYRLEVTASGFEPAQTEALDLTAGRTVRADVALKIGTARQSVEVRAETSKVDTAATAWGSSIDEQQLSSLPLNGRDLFDLAAQQPNVTVPASATQAIDAGLGLHISVNGNRPSENAFRLDGIYIDDATGSAPASAAGNLLGIDTIDELRMVASPFSAEYGRTDGGILTAVSKSGANDFHGSGWEYLRNSAFDAKNYFDPAGKIPALRLNQFGGLFDGPIVHNKLFFLADYEGIRSAADETQILTTPDAAARQGMLTTNGVTKQVPVNPAVVPYLALYPLPNGPDLGGGIGEFIGSQPTNTSENYAVGKVDYLATDRLHFGMRYTGDTAYSNTGDPFHFWSFDNNSHYNLVQTTAQYVQSPTTIHDIRVAFSQIYNSQGAFAPPSSNSLAFVPGDRMGAIQVVGLSDFGGTPARTGPRHFNTVDGQTSYSLEKIAGAHSLSLGTSYDRILLGEAGDLDRNGYYQFTSLQNFLEGIPSRLSIMAPASGTLRHWSFNQFSAFVQDNWRITRRLTVGVGVRYETATTPVERNGLEASLRNPLTDKQVTVGGPLWINPSKLNFAPRASIAWDPFGDGRTAVRVGSGIFYDLLGTRELTVSGMFMPPFYERYNISKAPFPNALSAIEGAAPPPPSVDGLSYWPSQPYVLQYQALIERDLGHGVVAEVGYSGSRGLHLVGDINNIDTTIPQFLPDGQIYFNAALGPINPAFSGIGMRETDFDSHYNSLNADARATIGRRLHVQGKFAWSHAIDDDSIAIHEESYLNEKVPTMYNFADNTGSSDFDCRLVFAANFLWDLPGTRSRAANVLLGGWALDGLMQAQSGNPFNPVVGFDNAGLLGSGDQGQRPNLAAINGPIITGNPARYFNPLAFSLPPAGYLGDLGRNVLTGPGLVIVSLALQREFLKAERRALRIRAEGFNVANHPNFQVPSGTALYNSSGALLGTAGQITATTTSSRLLQLSARYSF
jgi:hypothetical protein